MNCFVSACLVEHSTLSDGAATEKAKLFLGHTCALVANRTRHLTNEIQKIMAVDLRKPHSGRTPEAMAIKMRDAMFRTDLHSAPNFSYIHSAVAGLA